MYLVYDSGSFLIVFESEWFNGAVQKALKKSGNLLLNVTHPKTKNVLAKINKANGTCYGGNDESRV